MQFSTILSYFVEYTYCLLKMFKFFRNLESCNNILGNNNGNRAVMYFENSTLWGLPQKMRGHLCTIVGSWDYGDILFPGKLWHFKAIFYGDKLRHFSSFEENENSRKV